MVIYRSISILIITFHQYTEWLALIKIRDFFQEVGEATYLTFHVMSKS